VAALLGVQIALPFLLRRVRKAAIASGVSQAPGALARGPEATGASLSGTHMRWHYLLGFILPAAALGHGWIPMASGHMPHTSMTGLWLATFALGLLFLQLLIGLTVQRLQGSVTNGTRLGLRRVHFFTMLVIAALALSHMLLN